MRSNHSEVVDPAKHRRLLEAFVAAARNGDIARLEQLLADDVVSTTDGAGSAHMAARRPVLGRAKVARLVAGIGGW